MNTWPRFRRTRSTPATFPSSATGVERGAFFRPVKQQITLRLDADLIDWFKRHPKPDKGYQTTINQALREYVVQHDRD